MGAISSPRMLVNISKTTLYNVLEKVNFIVIAMKSRSLTTKECNGNLLCRGVVLPLKVVQTKVK